MKFRLWHFVVISSISLAAGLAVALFRYKNSQTERINPKRGPIVEAIYGLGKVKSRRRYEVKMGVVDNVQKVFVQEGQTVKTGDPLIKLSDAALFRAPYSGTVTLVEADPGEIVAPQAPILRVEDLNELYIEVSLEQQGALRVKKGQPVEVVFESLRSQKFNGAVQYLFPKNDEFLAHIQIKDMPNNVLPGMTADLAIVVSRKDKALLVPISAVTNGQVILLRNGKRQKIPVKIGGVDNQWAEVLDGDLRESDEIIIGKRK